MSGFTPNNGFDANNNGGFDVGNNGFNQNGGYDQSGPPNGNGSMENIPPPGAAQPTTTSDAARTLWMGDLDSWMDDGFIKQVFLNAINEDVSVKIIRDRNAG